LYCSATKYNLAIAAVQRRSHRGHVSAATALAVAIMLVLRSVRSMLMMRNRSLSLLWRISVAMAF
jgi:hypothetical protein